MIRLIPVFICLCFISGLANGNDRSPAITPATEQNLNTAGETTSAQLQQTENKNARTDAIDQPSLNSSSAEAIITPEAASQAKTTAPKTQTSATVATVEANKKPAEGKSIPSRPLRTINGKITLKGPGARRIDLADTVIYFLPDAGAPMAEPDVFTLSMRNKIFTPRVMAVPVGSKIEIPNEDRISHNAFSPSKPNDFDLGTYTQGKVRGVTIEKEGIVKIYCNVHYHMVAYVLALNTPYVARADDKGLYSLDIPDQPGKLVVWHERSTTFEQRIESTTNENIDATLKVTKRRIEKHDNKFGTSYRKSKS